MKVFISHSSLDIRFVRTLKEDLKENGIDTFVDEDSLDLGDSLMAKLQQALDESSHFLIVLSHNSVKSDWVQFELEKAIGLFDKKRLAKIIPIKYHDCHVPDMIKALIHGDLSGDVVRIDSHKVIFLSDGYNKMLPKLIDALRVPEVSKIESPVPNERLIPNEPQKQPIYKHKILNYKDVASKDKFVKVVEDAMGPHGPIKIFPIVLPAMYSEIFKRIRKADKLKFILTPSRSMVCYFAGFRHSGNHIVMQQAVREFLEVKINMEYEFQIDIEKRSFKLL